MKALSTKQAIIIAVLGILLIFPMAALGAKPINNFYTFTSFADGSPLYIRKDCICTITTTGGDVYIVPTNGSSVRVKESMDEVKKITGIR